MNKLSVQQSSLEIVFPVVSNTEVSVFKLQTIRISLEQSILCILTYASIYEWIPFIHDFTLISLANCFEIIPHTAAENSYFQSLISSCRILEKCRLQRGEEVRNALPGPNMKPTAWQALVLAMALVLSVREVAPAMYDRTTATFP